MLESEVIVKVKVISVSDPYGFLALYVKEEMYAELPVTPGQMAS